MVDGLAQSVDIFPTILDLAGINVTAAIPPGVTIDGLSLLPFLGANGKSASIRPFAYSEQFARGDYSFKFERAIRDQRFKLVERSPDLPAPKEELYDLAADPLEQTDLLTGGIPTDQQQKLDELRAAMARLLSTR